MNVEQLAKNTSKRSRERVISSQLKQVFQEDGISTRGGTTKLRTGGKPITATLGKPKVKPAPKFTNEVLTKLQMKMNTSDRKMNTLANFLRIHCGRDSVNKLEDHMTHRNQKLMEHFDATKVLQTKYVTETDDNGKKKRKRSTKEEEVPVVFANDVEDLVGLIMEERKLDANHTVGQVGIDDGQGLLKIMLSLKEDEPEPVVKNKKMKYSEGFAPKDFKLSGVKKLVLLLVSPTTERYDNMSTLLSLLGIEALDFGNSDDIKMVLMLLGKQPASSKYCCPFCYGCHPWIGNFEPVTIGSLWADYTAFVEAGGDVKTAMKFHNVINPPLVTGPSWQRILEIFLFPEHHVFTGIVGKLVKELERSAFDSPEEGQIFMDKWMAEPGVNVSRTVYMGSANFIGNMAELLLERADSLLIRIRQYLALRPDKLLVAEKFVQAMNEFNDVRKSCFGQTLSDDYISCIEKFMGTYRSLEISIPLKVLKTVQYFLNIS